MKTESQEREAGYYWIVSNHFGIDGPMFYKSGKLSGWSYTESLPVAYHSESECYFDEIGERITRQQPVSKEAIRESCEAFYENQRQKGETDDITENPNPYYGERFYQAIFDLMSNFTYEWLQSQNNKHQ